MKKHAWAILVTGFCIVLVAYAIRYSYGILLPEMLPSLGISKSEAGMVYSSFIVSYTLFSPVVGVLADRTDIRTLLTSFCIVLGIGTLLMSFSSSLVQAGLFFAIAGAGAAACWAPVVSLTSRSVSDRHRGKALAFVNAGSAVGVAIGSLAMPPLIRFYTWRMGWAGLGILAFLVALMTFVLIRNNRTGEKGSRRNAEPPRQDSKPARFMFVKALGSKFWLLGLSYALVGSALNVPYTFLSTYAVQELGLQYEIAARLITIIAVTSFFGMLALGVISDSIGRFRLIILCNLLVIAGSLGMVYNNGFLALSLSCAVFGVPFGAIWSLYAACPSDYFPRQYSGAIMGFWTMLYGICSAIAPVVSGWVADLSGTLAPAFIISALVAVASLLLLLPVGKAPSTPNAR